MYCFLSCVPPAISLSSFLYFLFANVLIYSFLYSRYIARNNVALHGLHSSVDPSLLPNPPAGSSSMTCPADSDSKFSPSEDSADSSDEPLDTFVKDYPKKHSKMKCVLSPSKSPQKKKRSSVNESAIDV